MRIKACLFITMKMFKKKNDLSLPPLPKPPTDLQMAEDVDLADDNDPVYLEGACKNMFDERSKLDVKFETVKEFIEASNSLKDLLKKTEDKLSTLQNSRDELQQMTENIKQQAVRALE